MNTEKKQAIKAWLDKTGEWFIDENQDGDIVMRTIDPEVPGRSESVFGFHPEIHFEDEDAEFIANMPNVIRELLVDLDAAEQERREFGLKTIQNFLSIGEIFIEVKKEEARLQSEVDRLRILLERMCQMKKRYYDQGRLFERQYLRLRTTLEDIADEWSKYASSDTNYFANIARQTLSGMEEVKE